MCRGNIPAPDPLFPPLLLPKDPDGGVCYNAPVETKTLLLQAYAPIAAPLEEVRGVVNGVWRDALRLVLSVEGDLPGAGGKGLRPALTLMAAGAVGERDLVRFARMAAAYELLHMASLAHDDVVDHAFLRRGNASLNALWDNHAAVLGGDYLVARAVETLGEYGSCEIVTRAVRTVRAMAECELAFFGVPADAATEEDCLRLAEGKTASLFAAACEAPALLAGKNAEADRLRRYGMAFGVAFQLMDDLLDLTQSPEETGKPACGDIAEGKATVPLIRLREALPPDDRDRLTSLSGKALGKEDIVWVQTRLSETGVAAEVAAGVAEYADTARTLAQEFPGSPFRNALSELTKVLVLRKN